MKPHPIDERARMECRKRYPQQYLEREPLIAGARFGYDAAMEDRREFDDAVHDVAERLRAALSAAALAGRVDTTTGEILRRYDELRGRRTP